MTQSAARHVHFTPGKRLGWVLVACLPLFAWGTRGMWFGIAADALILLAAWLETRRLRTRLPQLTRRMPARFVHDAENRVTIEIHNPSSGHLSGQLRDAVPSELCVDHELLSFELPAHGEVELVYSARSSRRGLYTFGDLALRLDGPLGLGAVTATQPAAASVRVYPSPRGPVRYELALRRGALRSVGIRSTRALGGQGEFEQLREYVAGDALRDLDWKATAKRLRPVTRVHGQEQSQNVLLALDVGRLMSAPLEQQSKLDHAIHAALLVAWVALRAGDRVGLVVFGRDVQRFVLPARGRAQYLRLLSSVYDLEASDDYVDFRALAQFIRTRVVRRSLVLLFSELLEESQAVPSAVELPKLGTKHWLACVTLSDPALQRLAHGAVDSSDQAYMRAAATDLLAERAVIHARLTRAGIAVVEASAGELAVAAVNRYLAIKRQHRL
jgi:uncharacterized protein (DUF58 family)